MPRTGAWGAPRCAMIRRGRLISAFEHPPSWTEGYYFSNANRYQYLIESSFDSGFAGITGNRNSPDFVFRRLNGFPRLQRGRRGIGVESRVFVSSFRHSRLRSVTLLPSQQALLGPTGFSIACAMMAFESEYRPVRCIGKAFLLPEFPQTPGCKYECFSAMNMPSWVFAGRGKGRFRLKGVLPDPCRLSRRKPESVMCSEGFNAAMTARESSNRPPTVWD
jgi:hypothetical protein